MKINSIPFHAKLIALLEKLNKAPSIVINGVLAEEKHNKELLEGIVDALPPKFSIEMKIGEAVISVTRNSAEGVINAGMTPDDAPYSAIKDALLGFIENNSEVEKVSKFTTIYYELETIYRGIAIHVPQLLTELTKALPEEDKDSLTAKEALLEIHKHAKDKSLQEICLNFGNLLNDLLPIEGKFWDFVQVDELRYAQDLLTSILHLAKTITAEVPHSLDEISLVLLSEIKESYPDVEFKTITLHKETMGRCADYFVLGEYAVNSEETIDEYLETKEDSEFC